MDIIKKLLEVLHSVSDSIIIGVAYDDREEETRRFYPNLSDNEYFGFKTRGILCYGMAQRVMNLLNNEKIPNQYIFIYTNWLNVDNQKRFGFNKLFLEKIQKSAFAEATHLCNNFVYPADTFSCTLATHGMVEVVWDNKVYLLDPYCGLLYVSTKEELIKNPDLVYNSYKEYGQVDYLLNSIHINKSNLIVASPVFWENVKHISNSACGDFPKNYFPI